MTRLLIALLMAVTACDTPLPPAPHAGPTAGGCGRASARDFDGDGRDDVAVSRQWDGGSVHLLTAGKLVPLPVPAKRENAAFGQALTLAHVNGDRCVDVVVGAPIMNVDGKEAAGAVFVYYGGSFASPLQLNATHPREGDLFGWSLAAYGDLLAIGSPGAADGGGGAVHLARNGTLIRSFSQDSEGVPGSGEEMDHFGGRVALGPLASGKVGLVVGAQWENDDGPGRQEPKPNGPEAGAVTVIHDVTAAKPAATRLRHPTEGSRGAVCADFGASLAYVRGVGLAATGSDCDRIQFYGLDLRPTRTVPRPPSAAADSGATLAASERGQVAALWTNPGGTPALQLLTPSGDSSLPGDRLRGSFGVTFSGDRIVLGSIGGPYGNVAVVDPSTGATELIEAPGASGWGDPIAG